MLRTCPVLPARPSAPSLWPPLPRAAATRPNRLLAPSPHSNGVRNVRQAGGVQVIMEVPAPQFRIGDQVPVTVRARNTTDKPISIVSEGRNLVRVKLYRTFGVGWELLKEYPALALPVRSEWQLPPHGQRVFQLTVPVEPNWPTAENILLRAVLDNGPEAEPGVLVDIEPQLPKIGEKPPQRSPMRINRL